MQKGVWSDKTLMYLHIVEVYLEQISINNSLKHFFKDANPFLILILQNKYNLNFNSNNFKYPFQNKTKRTTELLTLQLTFIWQTQVMINYLHTSVSEIFGKFFPNKAVLNEFNNMMFSLKHISFRLFQITVYLHSINRYSIWKQNSYVSASRIEI